MALVAADDNVRISTQRHGRRFSYRALLDRVAKESRVGAPLAVVTAAPGDQGRQHYLETRGWRTLVLPREMCVGVNGLGSAPTRITWTVDKAFTVNARSRTRSQRRWRG